jgi:hypothetical protein
VTAGPNQCVPPPHEPLYAAKGHDHQIALLPPYDAVFNDPASDTDNYRRRGGARGPRLCKPA